MKIAELNGEKTVKTLAKHLLATPPKGRQLTTQPEMETALLRLNPQLERIKELPRGTPILVPEEFPLAREQSARPLKAMTDALLQHSEEGLANLRAVLKQHAAGSGESIAVNSQEQGAVLAAQTRTLDQVQTALAEFRARIAAS